MWRCERRGAERRGSERHFALHLRVRLLGDAITLTSAEAVRAALRDHALEGWEVEALYVLPTEALQRVPLEPGIAVSWDPKQFRSCAAAIDAAEDQWCGEDALEQLIPLQPAANNAAASAVVILTRERGTHLSKDWPAPEHGTRGTPYPNMACTAHCVPNMAHAAHHVH